MWRGVFGKWYAGVLRADVLLGDGNGDGGEASLARKMDVRYNTFRATDA